MLLASTALAGLPLAASAQGVTLSGFAEMGVADHGKYHDDNKAKGKIGAEFFQDIDVTFTATGQTDGGVTWKAAVDLDEASKLGQDGDNGGHAGVAVSVSGAFGSVTLGDTDGAFDAALAEIEGGGASIADNHEHGGRTGNGGLDGTARTAGAPAENDPYKGQILTYSTGSLIPNVTAFASFEQETLYQDKATGAAAAIGKIGCTGGTVCPKKNSGDVLGVGVSATFMENYGIGVGYQKNDNADIVGASASATVPLPTGSLAFVVNYSRMDDDMGTTTRTAADARLTGTNWTLANAETFADHDDIETVYTGIGVTYATGPFSLHANYGKQDLDGPDQNTPVPL